MFLDDYIGIKIEIISTKYKYKGINTMYRFIKLTSVIINSSKITKIVNTNNKYYIHMSDKGIDGFLFLTSGSVSSENHIIEVCEKNHKSDYTAVAEWIKNIQ